MKRKRYTDEQIAYALRQAEAGTPIKDRRIVLHPGPRPRRHGRHDGLMGGGVPIGGMAIEPAAALGGTDGHRAEAFDLLWDILVGLN